MAKKRTRASGAKGAVDAETAVREAFSAELLQTLSAIAGSLGAIALRLAPAREKLHTEGDKMHYLSKLGLEKKVIAGIMASTEATVSTRLSEKSSKKKSSTKPAKKRPKTRRRTSGNR
jgi:hypothetical protein